MNFSMKLSPRVEHVMWGAVAGALTLAAVGFGLGGWMTGGAGAKIAQEKAEKALGILDEPLRETTLRFIERYVQVRNGNPSLCLGA